MQESDIGAIDGVQIQARKPPNAASWRTRPPVPPQISRRAAETLCSFVQCPVRANASHCLGRHDRRGASTATVLAWIIATPKPTFWTAFLRKLARRCLRSVKRAISDAHEASRPQSPSAERHLAALPRSLHATDLTCGRSAVAHLTLHTSPARILANDQSTNAQDGNKLRHTSRLNRNAISAGAVRQP